MSDKVLLLYPPVINQVPNINITAFDKTVGNYPPLGLLYIATYLKKFTDYEAGILDCFAKRLGFEEIKAELSNIRPRILGISAMTHFWVDVLEIARIAKELLPHIKIIVGGPHATIYPVSTVKNKYIDYAVCGEAEICFSKLVGAIFNDRPEDEISKIPGVATKLHAGQKTLNDSIAEQRIEDLNNIPFPDRTLIDNDEYFSIFAKKGTFTTLMTSRGCPFKCIFCDRLGKEFRPLAWENVIKEIRDCIHLGITSFFVHDDTFTVDRQRVQDICQAIIRDGLEIRWQVRSRPDCVDFQLLELMRAAGLSRISFGVESGNEKVLANLRKGIKLSRAKEVFNWCRELKITTFADFMFGSPGETGKEINDTLNFIKEIKPDYAQFSITCPYPATPLYKELLEEGKIKSDVWLEFAENPDVNFIPPIASEYYSRQDLERIVAKAYRKVYFNAPFLIAELSKIRSPEMFFSRFDSAFSLLKG